MDDSTLFRQGITLFSGSILALFFSIIYSGTIYFRIFNGASAIQISRMSTAISNTITDFVFLTFLIFVLIDYFSKTELKLSNLMKDTLIFYTVISMAFLFISTVLEFVLLYSQIQYTQPKAFVGILMLFRVMFTIFFFLTLMEMRSRINNKNQGKRIITIMSYALIGLAIFTFSRPFSYTQILSEWDSIKSISTINAFSTLFRGIYGFFYTFTYIYLIIISKWNKKKV